MIPFFLFCGGIPLLFYLLILIVIHCRKKTVILSGQSDLLLLGFGLVGFVFSGPILFLVPVNALLVWGNLVWPLLIILYFLLVFYFGSLLNPQIIIYNTDRDVIISKIEQIVPNTGCSLVKMGKLFSIPERDIHFRIEHFTPFQNLSIIPACRYVRSPEWILFEQQIRKRFQEEPEGTSGKTPVLSLLALFLIVISSLGILWIYHHQVIIESFLLLQCN